MLDKLKDIIRTITFSAIMLDLLTILIPFGIWRLAQVALNAGESSIASSEADVGLVSLILSVLAIARAIRVGQVVRDERKKRTANTVIMLSIVLVIFTSILYFISLLAANGSKLTPSDDRFFLYGLAILLALAFYLWNGILAEYYEKKIPELDTAKRVKNEPNK